MAFVVELATGKHHKQKYPWGTIQQYLWDVSKHFEQLQFISPCSGIAQLGEVLEGIHKTQKHLTRGVRGVTLEMLILLALQCDSKDLEKVRNNLFYQMHYGSWARSASTLPKTQQGYSPVEQLAWQDVFMVGGAGQREGYLALGINSQKQDYYGVRLDETGHVWLCVALLGGHS